ncbi:MAG: SMP-30/gluconolactonase/LRE family protein [Gammaproteobacteria bacterium]|nr:SMP-30/gluconolactonase/LRE family protein [Gammaproteobacteria bacterium]
MSISHHKVKIAIGFLLSLMFSNSQAVIMITTYAGTGTGGFSGDQAAAANAQLNAPTDILTDTLGNLYISEQNNNRIRKVDANGNITTFAGDGTAAFGGDQYQAIKASFDRPVALALSPNGDTLYIADKQNNRIRQIDLMTNIITTIAGSGVRGYTGDGGLAINARLSLPQGLTVDINGNIYISDSSNQVIRKVEVSSGLISTIAGNGQTPLTNPPLNGADIGDGGGAISASLNNPQGLAIDNANNTLYIADSSHSRIRKVDLSSGLISSIIGDNGIGFSSGTRLAAATVKQPWGLVLAKNGDLFFSDRSASDVRAIHFETQTVTTIISNADLNGPQGLNIDDNDALYVADRRNNRIRTTANSNTPLNTVTTNNAAGNTTNPNNQSDVDSGTGGSMGGWFLLSLALLRLYRNT